MASCFQATADRENLNNQYNLARINSISTQAKPVSPNRNKPNPCLPNAIQSNPHQDNTNHPNPTPHDPTQSNAFCSWPPCDPFEISVSPLSAIIAPCLPVATAS